MKTPEELLRPRYKVIAEYPDCYYKIGQILTTSQEEWVSNDNAKFAPQTVSEYPHLFKRLEWYEDRSIEDMPEYILLNTAIPKVILRVIEWGEEDGSIYACATEISKIENLWAILPVTFEEYTAYIHSQKQNS